MRALIIEDELLAAERLQLLINQYDQSVEVIAVLESIEDAVNWFQQCAAPDLLFLDIELADGNCFNIFDKIQVRCPIIFTTAYDKYALDAFRLYSIDYLLKPVTAQALSSALNKYKDVAASSLNKGTIHSLIESIRISDSRFKKRFLVKLGSKMFFSDAKDVAYFYADDKTVYLVHKNGAKFIVEYTLEKLQQVMDPDYFFRINRKVICSTTAIKEIKTYVNSRLKVILQAGGKTDEAIVSRERVQDFKEWAEA